MTTTQQTAWNTLLEMTSEALNKEYADRYEGLKGVLTAIYDHYADVDVRYNDIQRTVLSIINSNRALANEFIEFFDSDYGLANYIIDTVRETVAA